MVMTRQINILDGRQTCSLYAAALTLSLIWDTFSSRVRLQLLCQQKKRELLPGKKDGFVIQAMEEASRETGSVPRTCWWLPAHLTRV